jgi:phosphoserine aminotransferase
MALRPFNFSAGPAAMPAEVLAQAAEEMLDWPDASGRRSGMGVMEMSHRGRAFGEILARAQADFRSLMAVPDHFHILFMQGGGAGQNAIVPLNLCGPSADTQAKADFVVTGGWSAKSLQEASKYCQAHEAARSPAFRSIPDPGTWQLSRGAAYVHLCSNETVHGVEFHTLPDLAALGCDAPLVIDCSSHIASRPLDWSRVGLAYAGAQKNLGPAGLTLVVVRQDLLERALPACPSVFRYQELARHDSMVNTPPTFGIYMAGLVFQWLLRQGGIAAMEQRNIAKAQALYAAIDASALFYNPVDPACRSRMNVPFFLRAPERTDAFLASAEAAGLLQLKGHKSLGGLRASLYNAMPMEGVQTLISLMREFERTQA